MCSQKFSILIIIVMVLLWACSYLNSSFINITQRISCPYRGFSIFLTSLWNKILLFSQLLLCSFFFFHLFNAILTCVSVSLMIYARSPPSLFNVRHKQSILFWENTAVNSWLQKKKIKDFSILCHTCSDRIRTKLLNNFKIFHIFKVTWSILFWRRTSNENCHGNYLKTLHWMLCGFIGITLIY